MYLENSKEKSLKVWKYTTHAVNFKLLTLHWIATKCRMRPEERIGAILSKVMNFTV